MDYIVDNAGVITNAVSAQVWSGEAAVHVSIVNWTKNGQPKGPYHLSVQRGDSINSPWDTFELGRINSALATGHDVTGAAVLHTNGEACRVYNGQFPRHSGFVIDTATARDLIRQNSRNRDVVHPFLIGREMLVHGEPQRFVIDFQKRDPLKRRATASRSNIFVHVCRRMLKSLLARNARKPTRIPDRIKTG